MESKGSIFLNPEDYEDFHRLAAKVFGRDPSQPGRPTKEEQEFRAFLEDFEKFRLLKRTGAFDKFFSDLRTDTREPRHTERSRQSDTRSGKSLFGKLLGGKFEVLDGIFNEELIQETVKAGLVQYGPIAVLLGGLYIAETTIKIPMGKGENGEIIYEPFPPILHTMINILVQLLRLLDVAGNFISSGLGGITDLINDPIGTVFEGPIDTLNTILNIHPDETPEEKTARLEVRKEKRKELERKLAQQQRKF